MDQAVEAWDGEDLAALLALDEVGPDRFANRCNQQNVRGALFGGQLLGQGLHAAAMTVEGRAPHSLHACFLASANPARRIGFEVERPRDGGSFSVRRVTARQGGEAVFTLQASFQAPEDGAGRQLEAAPEAPPPETLATLSELAARYDLDETSRRRIDRYRALDVRPVDPERHLFGTAADGATAFWLRAPSLASAGERMRAAGLAYASDYWLALSAKRPYAPALEWGGFRMASLDHALWLHRPADPAQWLLYEMASPWSGGGRGLARGAMFDETGRLVASIAQEALVRRR